MASPLTATDRKRLETLSTRLDRTGTLATGDTGGAVQALENVLATLGFTPGTIDTTFDGTTRGTLKNFQDAVGLTPTGELDRETLKSLSDALIGKRGMPDAIRRGQKSDAIAKAERQLKLLGYDPGARDGISDGKLAQAIAAFKRDQKKDFDNTAGLLSAAGQQVLTREASGFQHDAWHGRRDLTASQQRQDQVLAELSRREHSDGTVGIGEGAKRPAIEQLQARLSAAGYSPKRHDGVFDERTRGALEAFQRHSGVAVTGRLDPATWKKLKGAIIDTDQPASPVQRLDERSGAVKRTEALLAKAGFHPGQVDGLYSKQTAKAVRAFERKTGRRVDGELGARDLARLKKLAANPFPRPPDNYHHIAWRGVTVNGRTIAMVNQAEAWAKQHGVAPGWGVWQGSYNKGVTNSAGTHDGGGALDLKITGKTPRQIHTMVEAMRRAGFAAWYRPTMDPPHIHAIAIGDRDMSAEAHAQVVEYFHGGDGLVGTSPDPQRDIGRPIPEWAKVFRDRIL